MKFLRLVVRNVLRQRTRAVLTMGSVVLVLLLAVALLALLSTLERKDTGAEGGTRIFVQHASGLGSFLPLSYRPRIAELRGVRAVVPQTSFFGTYIDQRPQNFFVQLSTDPQAWDKVYDDFEVPARQLADWRSRRDAFLAGQQLVDRYH